MTPVTNSIGFRLPPETVKKLDRYAERWREETGFAVNRTQALLRVLKVGFEQLEEIEGRRRPKK
jgi:hypothetical protein